MRLIARGLGLFLGLCIVCVSFTETAAQNTSLQVLAEQKRTEWQQERAEVEKFAKERGVPIRRVYQDGVVELKRIVGEFPVYDHTHNLGAAITSSVDAVWPDGDASFNLTGEGETLGIWDGGGVRLSHDEFGGRVTQEDDADNYNFHATHVAGTMVAKGVDPAAKGMAFEAGLHAYDWENDQGEMITAAADGLQVSNHSYGRITGWRWNSGYGRWEWYGDPEISETQDYRFGLYSELSEDWDEIAYNAPHYLIVKSVGNDHLQGPDDQPVRHWVAASDEYVDDVTRDLDGGPDGYTSLGERAVAKNILAVGAVSEIEAGYQEPGDVQITAFSSWGPTNDGRIKPDIVAKGESVYSSLEEADDDYGTLSGTSMSTPVVSGSVGLLDQYYRELHGESEQSLSSTTKALLIHTASQAGEKGPDYRYGWGLLNVQRAVELLSEAAEGDASVREVVLDNDQEVNFTVSSRGYSPIRATIAWTDPPGTPVDADENNPSPDDLMLVNDLDLRITGPDGTVYEPYILEPENPSQPADTGDNSRDNVEQVFVEDTEEGDYTITISHKGNLEGGAQEVSLISSTLSQRTLTLDNVKVNKCNETWVEQEAILSFVPTTQEDCSEGSCYFGIEESKVWLYPSRLNIDVSNIQAKIGRVEVDVRDWCGSGCTKAFLYSNSDLVDSTSNTKIDSETLYLYNSQSTVDTLAVSSCEATVSEIRIYHEPELTGSLQITIQPQEAAEADAQWRRVGTSVWFDSCEEETDVPVGEYEIEFKPVPGWQPEGTIEVQVQEGETATATTSYVEQDAALPGVMMLLLEE